MSGRIQASVVPSFSHDIEGFLRMAAAEAGVNVSKLEQIKHRMDIYEYPESGRVEYLIDGKVVLFIERTVVTEDVIQFRIVNMRGIIVPASGIQVVTDQTTPS